MPALEVDRKAGDPLYLQVARHIEGAVRDGTLRPGDTLTGELGLSAAWGVSRATMRKAIEELVVRGILIRRHGAGTQVMPQGADGIRGVEGLSDELRRRRQKPEARVLQYECIPADDDIARTLMINVGDEVLHLERLRLADGAPIAIMRNWIPGGRELVPRKALERVGLYELLRSAGIQMRVAQQSVGAHLAGAASARLLAVKRGAPLLSVHTTTFSDTGRPVELGRHEYRGDLYRFDLTKVERRLTAEAIQVESFNRLGSDGGSRSWEG